MACEASPSQDLKLSMKKLQKKVPLGPVKPNNLAMNSQSPPRLSQNSEMVYFALDGLLASQLEECDWNVLFSDITNIFGFDTHFGNF